MTTAISSLIQSFNPGKMVELFVIEYDGGVSYFANDTAGGNTPISYGGNVYLPIPIEATGFAWEGGKQPRPRLVVGNANNALTGVLLALDDLSGAQVTRIKTFEIFLDSGSEPDGNAYYSREVFSIERKSKDDGPEIEFELATPYDLQNISLPGRKMVRDYCFRVYRRPNPTKASAAEPWQRFDYDFYIDCPYSGDAMFTKDNEVTTDYTKDVCSHTPDGCEKRFPIPLSLPGYFFPALGLTQAR
jgi:lambda family phage minor tail protein L